MMDSSESSKLTHFDAAGQAHMVNVGHKGATARVAVAEGLIRMHRQALACVAQKTAHKGDVLAVARVAAIQGAKQTSALIPLCHLVALTHVAVDFSIDEAAGAVRCQVRAETVGPTGVEMEALTGVQVALLTIYDMCKSLDRHMLIDGVRLMHKQGGQRGDHAADASERNDHAV